MMQLFNKFFYALLLCFITFIQAIDSMETHYLTTNSGSLFYKSIGKGPPLIVIHGGPGLSHDYLLPGMEIFAEYHQLIFFDQRGCGQSQCAINEKTINIVSFIQDIEALRKHLGYKKISILGHSWGGFLAMRYAFVHKDKLNHLILSNTMPASSQDLKCFIQNWIAAMAPFQKELTSIQSSDEFIHQKGEIAQKYYHCLFQAYCFDQNKAKLLNLHLQPDAFFAGLQVGELLKKQEFAKPFSYYSQIKALNVPTLVIHGEHDIIPLKTAQNLADHLPNAQYVVLKQCGHFPYVEQQNQYFHAIKHFLQTNITKAH